MSTFTGFEGFSVVVMLVWVQKWTVIQVVEINWGVKRSVGDCISPFGSRHNHTPLASVHRHKMAS